MFHFKKMVLLYLLLPGHCSGLHHPVWTISSPLARAFDETDIKAGLKMCLRFKVYNYLCYAWLMRQMQVYFI